MSERSTCIFIFLLGFLLILWSYCYQFQEFLFYQSSGYRCLLSNYHGNANGDINSQDVSRLVSFHDSVGRGRRLGNQIFNLAAVLFVAELINGTAVMSKSLQIALEQVFKLKLPRVCNLCPCYTVDEEKSLSYDVKIENVNELNTGNNTILVKGYRQSWKYTLGIEQHLRRHLVFKDEIQRFAESFLHQNIPCGWTSVGFVRVGIHIRRGDILSSKYVGSGYTTPNETYYFKAMKYFTDMYSRVQFIFASDDVDWTYNHFFSRKSSSEAINLVISRNNAAGQDLAILSMCDHVIMSTGTFGWWAAWLAKGTTIYYSDWPLAGSGLDHHFDRADFFNPFWIPMSS